jgi:hypothetical protein
MTPASLTLQVTAQLMTMAGPASAGTSASVKLDG